MSRYSNLQERHMYLLERVQILEKSVTALEKKEPTLSVPVVDEDGKYAKEWVSGNDLFLGFSKRQYKDITIRQAFDALEEMCGVEITYQEFKGTSKVVIYEKD